MEKELILKNQRIIMESIRLGTDNEWLQTHLDAQIQATSEELSKLHQPTVISAVCNSPCCKEQGVFDLPLGSEWYCKEHYKQTDL